MTGGGRGAPLFTLSIPLVTLSAAKGPGSGAQGQLEGDKDSSLRSE